ncbi:oligosaccharide flippase family protein [Photobacterium damselae]|uniref:Oligosaccharide flippase family protein n=1 Tax=Photobacterium damselae subsp. damselae TaxID=85581 RepID=A0AAD3WXH3_PHODD|nr:oligosaccharide flippase family protein [Photobacterium damselae]KAB1183217.1 oligosaccharide flippase family protein [Photobacterium damselae subsp. damselae]
MLRKVTAIISGTLVAQLINVISLPILTRLFTPADIGVQNVFLSTLNILMPLVSLSLPMAIIQTKRNDEKYVNTAAILFTLLFIVFICIFFILFYDYMVSSFGTKHIYFLLIILIMTLFFNSYQQLIEYKLIKAGEYSAISKISVITSLYLNGFKILGGIFFSNFWCLLVAIFSAVPFKVLLQYNNIKIKKEEILFSLNTAKIKKTVFKYHDFILYRSPQALLSTLSLSIPLYFITLNSGLSEAAFYSLALTLLMLPVNLIGNSITTVLYPELVKIGKSKCAVNIVFKYFFVLVLVGCIISSIIFNFGSPIIDLFLGFKWIKTAEYASWLSIIMIFQLANRPIISAVTAFSYQHLMLWFEIIAFIVKIGVFYLAVIFFKGLDIIKIYSVISGGMYFIFSMYIVYRIKFDLGYKNEKENNNYK